MALINFAADWNIIKGKLRQAYGQLTDDDVLFARGKEEELIGRLQHKLGISAEDIYALIEKFSSKETLEK